MNTIHKLILILLLIATVAVSFLLGFYNGAYKASLLLSYTGANSNIKTYININDNSLNKASEIQRIELEMNIATLKDLKTHDNMFFVEPGRLFTFVRLFSTDGIDVNNLFVEYNSLPPMKGSEQTRKQ